MCYITFYLPEGGRFFAPCVQWTGRQFKLRRCRKMAADARVKITLRCNECKQRNYNTMKNKKNTSDRVELKKYCRFCRKHTVHTETK